MPRDVLCCPGLQGQDLLLLFSCLAKSSWCLLSHPLALGPALVGLFQVTGSGSCSRPLFSPPVVPVALSSEPRGRACPRRSGCARLHYLSALLWPGHSFPQGATRCAYSLLWWLRAGAPAALASLCRALRACGPLYVRHGTLDAWLFKYW